MVILAAFKVVLGILAFLIDPRKVIPSPQWQGLEQSHPLPPEISVIQLLIFGIAGLLLALGGKRERSAVFFGGFLLTLSAAWADRLLDAAALSFSPSIGSSFLVLISELPLIALSPFFLWCFVSEFPATPLSFRIRRRLRKIRAATAFFGVAILFVSAVLAIYGMTGPPAPRGLSDLPFLWALQMGWVLALLLGALGVLVWKGRKATGEQRRRGQLFIASLVIPLSPVILDVAVEALVPSYSVFLQDRPQLRLVRTLFANALILSIPFATGYAVLVQRAMAVKLIARRALRYAFARSTARGILAAPFLLICLYLYAHRHLTLTELFSGSELLLLTVLLVIGLAGIFSRRWILDAIDRRYFREQYNARQILTRLNDQIRSAQNLIELSKLIAGGIDLALHLESLTLLVEEPARRDLIDPKGILRPLGSTSRLLKIVRRRREPLEVDLESPDSPFKNLPETERHWLIDGRVRLLAPAFASNDDLIGLIVLGAKKSEAPFFKEDHQLLRAIASSTGLAIELLRFKEQSGVITRPPELDAEIEKARVGDAGPAVELQPPSSSKASECVACNRVYPPGLITCPHCKVEVQEASAPYVLRGMFRIEQRIGTGGMAVVYQARDLKLGRTVAIKTLPRVSPDAAIRLQREARTTAAVAHPGLAAIHGLETWEGTPMLILELLEGGTLADRIIEGPLLPLEVVITGQTVAMALEKIHSVGILHRDIKPSNIGYTRDGEAKLLDFGIARIREDLRRDRAIPAALDEYTGGTTSWHIERTATGNIAGTLPYVSPEALAGEPLDPSFDLWSLAVVMYEALTGENLFYGTNLKKMLEDIRESRVPDLMGRVPDCPQKLADFFKQALHKDKSQRPQSGRDFYRSLEHIRREIDQRSWPGQSWNAPG